VSFGWIRLGLVWLGAVWWGLALPLRAGKNYGEVGYGVVGLPPKGGKNGKANKGKN